MKSTPDTFGSRIEHDPVLDELVELAAQFCGTRFAGVSLLEGDIAHFPARFGFTEASLPRSKTFCSVVVAGEKAMVFPDLANEPMFKGYDPAKTPHGFRFYIGVPLTGTGSFEGTLFVADSIARDAKEEELSAIRTLARQVSSHLKREAELREIRDNRSLLSSIFDNLPVALFCKDSKDRFNYVVMNRMAEELFGVDRKEAIGKTDHAFFPKEQADFFRSKDIETLSSGQAVDIPEEPIDSRRLGRRWLHTRKFAVPDAEGKARYLLGISEDITDRKERDRIIDEEREKFNMIAENLGDVIWMTDPSKGKVLFISQAYEKVWGTPRQSLIQDSMAFTRSIHPEDRDRVVAAFPRQIRGTYDETYRVIQPNGTTRWVRDRAFPVRDPDGSVRYIVGLASDITELKKNEEIIQAQQMRIVTTAKMSSLGEMAGGLAHEINNPLTVIYVTALQLRDAIRSGRGDQQRLLDGVERVQRTVDRIAKIIKGLKTFSRNGENDPFAPVPLRQILDDTLELCRERFRHHGIDLKLPECDPELTIDCRGVQISQVLLNLLGNAFDAVRDQPGAWVEIGVTDADTQIHLSVTDSGTGIPPDVADKIMQPFFTTKRVGEGTGLGLSISNGIIEDHGGKLEYDGDSPNTRFVARVPKSH